MGGNKLTFTASVWREGKFFVAKCVELGVASQGFSREEALDNLREAVGLYLEDEDINEFAVPEIVKLEIA